MTRFEWYRSGHLFGIRYWLESVGDQIPEHMHAQDHEHNIIVLDGSIHLHQAGQRSAHYTGEVLDFDGTKPHRIVARMMETQLLHLFLHGMPQGYDGLPESEHRGVIK